MAKPTKKKPAAVKAMKATKTIKAIKTTKPRKAAARPVPTITSEVRSAVLDRLWRVVLSRRDADPTISHSARLLSRGPAKVAQKFGEEAVECLIEAVSGNHEALVAESADVLYHLLVVWVAAGVDPNEVWAELERREGISGITEKAARPRELPIALGPQTKKIP
jgi:phosphoribosyl-ATP pyrophosphohydrolase